MLRFTKHTTTIVGMLLVYLLILPAPSALARERTLSFDSGYIPDMNSNRGFRDFGLEWVDLNGAFLDIADQSLPLKAIPYGESIFNSLFTFYTMNIYGVTFHEYGHGTRLESLGYRTTYRSGKTGSTTDSPWVFFFRRFGDPFNDAYAVYNTQDREFLTADRTFVNADGTLTTDGNILITAGGFGNSMSFAAKLSERLRSEGGAHPSEWIAYSLAKLDAFYYSDSIDGDLIKLENYYTAKNYNISEDDMRQASLFSFLLSQSTYAYFFNGRNTLHPKVGDQGRKAGVDGFQWHGFALPDVENYLTTKGLSWKVNSGYRFNDELYIHFGVEFVAKGEDRQEYSVRLQKKDLFFADMDVEADCTVGSALEFGVQASTNMLERVQVSAGWDHFDNTNLHGERNTVSFEHGDTSEEFWARLSILY